MFKKIASKSSNIYLVAGILVLIISAAGILNSVRQESSKITKSAFRYYIKNAEVSATINVTPASGIFNPEETTSSEQTYTILDPGKYFINSDLRPELDHPNIPTRIVIQKIKLDAPVIVPDFNFTNVDGETFGQWQAPSEFAAGWHPDSALLGEIGNTVINGHHNAFGMVFGDLVNLEVGDIIKVYAGNKEFSYVIANRMILAERFADAATRIDNARWLGHSDDERLTLVTCWPKETNTHRLILVARPYVEK